MICKTCGKLCEERSGIRCGDGRMVCWTCVEEESNEPSDEYVDEVSDLDQNNPVDCSAEVWADIYSNPNYDADNDHSMDY